MLTVKELRDFFNNLPENLDSYPVTVCINGSAYNYMVQVESVCCEEVFGDKYIYLTLDDKAKEG